MAEADLREALRAIYDLAAFGEEAETYEIQEVAAVALGLPWPPVQHSAHVQAYRLDAYGPRHGIPVQKWRNALAKQFLKSMTINPLLNEAAD